MRQSSPHLLSSIFLAVLLAGCGEAAQPPAGPIPTPPEIPRTTPITPPPQAPPSPMVTVEPAGGNEVFTFVRTVAVTSDPHTEAAMGYIHYIPATDRLVVMIRLKVDRPVPMTYTSQTCSQKAYGYIEYNTDMEPTGKTGFYSCATDDAYSMNIGNDMYFASMIPALDPPSAGNGSTGMYDWRLEKFDAVTWKRLADADIDLDTSVEWADGPTLSLLNGQVTVSGEYFIEGKGEHPLGRGSHHHFFTTDLESRGELILKPPEYPAHCPEVSMIQEPGGDILMFAATAYDGDLMVLRFDKDWNFKEKALLREKAFFPTGLATDGRLYYVAYTDTHNGVVYRNVRLAVYDAAWNTLQDAAVTDFEITPTTKEGWNPSLLLHGNRLYLSYIITERDETTEGWVGQAFVNIYELVP